MSPVPTVRRERHQNWQLPAGSSGSVPSTSSSRLDMEEILSPLSPEYIEEKFNSIWGKDFSLLSPASPDPVEKDITLAWRTSPTLGQLLTPTSLEPVEEEVQDIRGNSSNVGHLSSQASAQPVKNVRKNLKARALPPSLPVPMPQTPIVNLGNNLPYLIPKMAEEFCCVELELNFSFMLLWNYFAVLKERYQYTKSFAK